MSTVPPPHQGGKKAPPPPSEDDMEDEEEEEAELQYDDDDDDEVDNEDEAEEEIVEEESSGANNAPVTSNNNSLKISLKRAPSPKHVHKPPLHQIASLPSSDSKLLTRTQTDPTATNEWDDETSAMEAAKQSERDKRHQPNMDSRMDDEDEDEDEDMPDDEEGDDLAEGGIVVIEAQAPPEEEDMSSSDSDSDSDSDSSSSDEDPIHISSSSARPASTSAPAPASSLALKSATPPQSQQQQRRSQTVTPPTVSSLASSPFEMLSHSAASTLGGNGGESSSSSLLDAMSNPPPPSMSNLRHTSSTSSSSSSHAQTDEAKKPKFSPTANVIKLSLKKTKAVDQQQQQIKEEDDIYEGGEAMEDEEDLPAVKQEGEQIRVKLEAATIPTATITASSSNNKLKLTIPRKPSASAPPPNVTAFHAPNGGAELKDEGVPQVKLEPISLPLTTHTTIVNPNPASTAASASPSASPSDSAASPSPSSASPASSVKSQIPPRTAITHSGRAALARYRSYFFSEKPEWTFSEPDKFLRIEGTEVNQAWVKRTGMRTPFIASNATALGMKIPRAADVDYRSVVSQLPQELDLIVIDVATQTESTKWKLDDWVKYIETPAEDRTAVCNIISLEVSQTTYAKANVLAPTFARENDWNSRLWPEQVVLKEKPLYENIDMLVAGKKHTAKKIKNDSSSSSSTAASASDFHGFHYIQSIPAPVPVQLYLLMGAAGSYTDFHVDFGGSSVWYHVVKGEKIFLLAEPTPENLKVYEEWNNGGKQAKTFLADLYHKRDMEASAASAAEGGSSSLSKKLTSTSPPLTVKRISVKAGETLFLPSGWIHSVFTPVDSLVFGANFLHGFHVSSQLSIYNIELNAHIPLRWKFPEFEALHWLWMKENIFRLRKPLAQLHISMWELQGLANCVKTAAWWMASSAVARLRGFDLSRRRFGSRFELPEVQEKILQEEAKAQELEEAIAAADDAIAQGQKFEARHLLEEAKQQHTYKYVSLNWEHNIPFEWNEALALLRELDALVSYNIYLIEREEYEDEVENGTHQANKSDDEVKDESYWANREQQATNCFQAAQALKQHSYDLIEMIEPSSLSWLRKLKKAASNRRMTAKESAEVISAALKTNNRRRGNNNQEDREPDELDKEEAQLEQINEHIKNTPLAPTASGRVRHHSSKFDDSVMDDAADEEAAAEDEEKDAQLAQEALTHEEAGSRSKRAAKRKREDDDSEEDDEEYQESEDSDEEYAESEDDEFEVDSKRNKKHGQSGRGSKKAKHDEKDASHGAAAPTGAPLNIKELQARARLAASAASSNASAKKKIGALAPAAAAPRALATMSTKDRIMMKMKSRR